MNPETMELTCGCQVRVYCCYSSDSHPNGVGGSGCFPDHLVAGNWTTHYQVYKVDESCRRKGSHQCLDPRDVPGAELAFGAVPVPSSFGRLVPHPMLLRWVYWLFRTRPNR